MPNPLGLSGEPIPCPFDRKPTYLVSLLLSVIFLMGRLLLFASFETDDSNLAMNRSKSAKNKSSLAI